MWDLPGPGLEPVTPALAGGFLTTAPPGKDRLVLTGEFWVLPGASEGRQIRGIEPGWAS